MATVYNCTGCEEGGARRRDGSSSSVKSTNSTAGSLYYYTVVNLVPASQKNASYWLLPSAR
jgi:hypothetical protein